MQTIKTYLYSIVVKVQLLDFTIFNVRNRLVYSQPIKIYQGIDNPVQILVLNQDQKSANVTGHTVIAEIQDPNHNITIKRYTVTWTNIQKGVGSIIIDKNTISGLEQRFYKLTLKLVNQLDNSENPMYIDDNYGVPLDLEILPAYYS